MPDAQRIGAVVPSVLRHVETQHGALFLIQRGWRRLVGKPLAAYTRPVSLRRGRLIVQADRPGDSYTLAFARPKLIKRLHALTDGRVEELIVRPAGPVSHAVSHRA